MACCIRQAIFCAGLSGQIIIHNFGEIMKRSVFVAGLLSLSLFALMGMGGSKQEPPKPQFAVVDTAKLYQESKLGKAGVERLEQLQNNALAKLESIQGDVKKAQDAKDDATVQRLQMEMQTILYSMQGAITAEQDKVVAAIQKQVEVSLEAYRQENGLFGVFGNESMLSYGKDVDATAAVMTLLDKQSVDFGPMPSLDAPAEPATTTPATTAPAAPAEEKAPEATAPAAEKAPAKK